MMNDEEYKNISSNIYRLNKKELFKLYQLIHKEKNKVIYNDFKQRMLYNNPKRLEDYINNFLCIPICRENYKKNIHLLMILLKDNGIYVSKQFIIGYTRDIKQDIELNNAIKLRNLEKRSISPNIYNVDYMNGSEFEHFIGDLFSKMGHIVIKITKQTRDQGADLITLKNREVNIIQAKRYKIGNNIGNDIIRDVVTAIKHYNAHNGMVITTSNFTTDCVQLARSNGIELINRFKLQKYMTIYL